MKVLHVLNNVRGTTIPVEIAAATDRLADVEVRLAADEPLPDELPDIVEPGQVREDLCGFGDVGRLLEAVAAEFDVVHTHTVREAAKVGVRAYGRPIVHVNTQHGHSHYTLLQKLGNLPGLALADAIVYNSRYTANSYNVLERTLTSGATEHVVHNGVDLEAVEGHRTTVEAPPTVVTATRLIDRKNLDVLIEAIAHADGATLRIVGDGPRRSALERTAAAAGVADDVEFLGYLPDREDVYEALAGADVFALPSRGEGFCVAVAEAMAVGLPVVVSDLPVFHEVVGDAGVFVDQEDPRAVGAAIEQLFDDPRRARRLGERNRRRIQERFSLERCARGYRDVYEQVLS